MSKRTTFATAILALAAGAATLGSVAQAQPYGYYGQGQPNYSYDPCKREKTGRGTIGALIGGAMGAVIGSNAAASGVRTEGSLLGGAVGAAIGAGVGNSSAACNTGQYTNLPPVPPPPAASAYAPPRYGYAEPEYRYEERRPYAYDDRSWAYGRRGERFRMAEGQGIDATGCTLAESPIYMPDGRTQTRFVRVCRDSSGRYQVVD